MVPFGFVAAGVVVVVLLVVAAGAVVPVVLAEAVPLPLPWVVVPELVAGVDAGVEAGSTVIGVGSGGSGFDRMPATSWSIPVVALLLRYLYQVARLSLQTALG